MLKNRYGYSVVVRRTDGKSIDFETKWERAKYLETILKAGEHISRAQLARRLGVHRSTVGRLVNSLGQFLPIIEDDKRRLCLADRE